MMATTLIRRLAELVGEYGDLPVRLINNRDEVIEIPWCDDVNILNTAGPGEEEKIEFITIRK